MSNDEYALVNISYQRAPNKPLRCIKAFAYECFAVARDLAEGGFYVAVNDNAGGTPWQWWTKAFELRNL